MIKVSFTFLSPGNAALFDREKGFFTIKVEGHAGHGGRGNDIVCAGVSAIVQTAVAAITKVAGVAQDIKQGEGVLETAVHLAGADSVKVETLRIILMTMLVGLEEIRNNYPRSLEINFE